MKGGKKNKRQENQPMPEQNGPAPTPGESERVQDATGVEAAPDEQVQQPEAVEPEHPPRETVLEERLLRLQADFDNFRKRTLREREDLYRRANEDIMLELLPVLDHLELAFTAAGDTGVDHPLVKGFALVGEQLRQVLRKFGLSEIETDGVAFDPNVHEAIQHLPSESVPENGLIACTRAGYLLGNRLLRAAQVVVSSGPQDAPDE